MSVLRRSWIGLLFGIMCFSQANAAVVGRAETIDYPGAAQTLAFGMNTAGDVVGSYVDTAKVEHGFLLRNGTFTSFEYPGAVWTEAWGINSQGSIAGQYGLSDGTTHGFLLRSGAFTALDVAGQPNTMPVKIAPDGSIVGCYHVNLSTGGTNLDTMHGFAMSASGVLTADPTARTMHNGVNPAGDIVGIIYDAAGPIHAYLTQNGTSTFFDYPGSTNTQAWDINAAGDIVGFYRDATAKFHGMLRHHGALTSFDVPGATATRATGINAVGDIVGRYTDAKNVTHGFVIRASGWWWDPDKPGTGFMIERQGNTMHVAALVYDYTGAPTWLVSSGPVANGSYTALAHAFTNGQTLTGAFQPAQDAGVQGVLQLLFSDSGTAQLFWTANPFMSASITLRRFGFTGGAGIPGTVENGWWSNPAELGRGFLIEAQDDNLFVVGYMFGASGAPTWYLAFGRMDNPMQFTGTWTQYAGGPTLLGTGGQFALSVANAGSVTVKFSDSQNGTLRLPDGRQISIARTQF